MRGYVRVTVQGLDTSRKAIKKGRGLNVTFNRNGNYAALIVRTGSSMNQREIVPLEKVPGSYRRHEFIDLYPADQGVGTSVNVNVQQQTPVNVSPVSPQPTPVAATAAPARPKQFCSQCGAEMEPDAMFCPNCGSPKD